MQHLADGIEFYGLWFVFLSVLATQLGLPLPAYPTLMLAAALLIPGVHSFGAILAAAVAATLLADLGWYTAGRTLGRRVLASLCRVSLSPDSCVRQTESIYDRFGAPSLLVAKFIPGFGAVATAMAGTLKTSLLSFLFFDALGAIAWTSIGLGIGRLFRNAITSAFDLLNELGHIGGAILVVGLALIVVFKWWERQRLLRTLRMARISVEELHDLIETGKMPIVFDVRTEAAQREQGRIPGARSINEAALARQLDGLPRTGEVVVYCACPSEASAARIAKIIMNHGFARVRPLAGGIDEWVERGYALEPHVGEDIEHLEGLAA
jgi:membrane protein DedA with SNARE-associated domain/rhodanese-related sulfurtransferase